MLKCQYMYSAPKTPGISPRPKENQPGLALAMKAGTGVLMVMLTRHSTKVTQDGSCVIGEDGEVPSMPAEGKMGV